MKPLISTYTFAFFSTFLLFSCQNKQQPETFAKHKLQVIAYYSGDGEEIENYNLNGVDQLIYSFLHLKGNRLAIDNAADSLTLRQLVGLKTRHQNLKVLVSLGGWGGCKSCSDVFETKNGRDEFAESTKEILESFGADGIDLDWEYPAISGFPGHPYKKADRENFSLLVKTLRRTLGSTPVISFAAGGFPSFVENSIDWPTVMPLVDYVNIMSYDLVGGYSQVTGHHTPLYSTTDQHRSADQCIQQLIAMGIPAQKLVIGAAFYGRVWEQVSSQNNGLYQEGQFLKGVGRKNFNNETQGFQFFRDTVAHAPYGYHPEKSQFITFDDSISVKAKTKYAKKHGLGGIMFWQLKNDAYENGLLAAILEENSQ